MDKDNRRLSAVPNGFVALAAVLDPICTAIRDVAKGDTERLAKIVGDKARSAPPIAIWECAYRAVYPSICRGELPVFTMHPENGLLLDVPRFIFLSAKSPSHLFRRPALHKDAGIPADYADFEGRAFFVRPATAESCVERAIVQILGHKKSGTTPAGPLTTLGRAHQAERDDLLGAVADGVLAISEAEDRAKLLGLGPLNPDPDPAEYDPGKEVAWSLLMALAWIAWRDIDRVRDFYPPYLQQLRVWRPSTVTRVEGSGASRTVSGYVLEPLQRLTGSLLKLTSMATSELSRNAKPVVSVDEAERLLREALADPESGLIAVCNGEPIPSHAWLHLEICEDKNGRTALRAKDDGWGVRSYRYEGEISIRRLGVQAYWRVLGSTAAGEPKAKKALEDAVKLHRARNEPLPVFARWSETAPKKYSISARGARRAWDAAAANYPELSSPKGKSKRRR